MKAKESAMHFKKIIPLLFVLVLFSCKDNKKTEDSKDVAEQYNKAKFDDSKEAKFMVNAAEISYEEIELARLAQSNAKNNNVKEIAKMMEKDHSQFLTELKELALAKQVTLPETTTSKGQNARTRLADKTGADFDKQYCDMAVDNHEKAIKDFIKATEDCEDAQVKNWAVKSLVTLRSHLDFAMTCKEAYKKSTNPEDRLFKTDTLKAMDKNQQSTNPLDSDKSKNNKGNKPDEKKKSDDKENKK
jgi:putative membrane protein